MVPGSPLEDYITLLDQQGLLGTALLNFAVLILLLDEADNVQQEQDDPGPPVKLWPLVMSAISETCQKLRDIHRGQVNHHHAQIKHDQAAHRQAHLEVTLSLLIESDLAQLEQALYVAQHHCKAIVKAAPVELGLLAPVFVAHFVYMVFAEPNR